jgi:hypothetical protein
MSDYMLEKEIDEAIASGEAALFSLKEAQNKLYSARNWGIFDMLGGGLISDIIKHSKMNDASAYLEEAKRDLLVFQRELQDVQGTVDLKVDVSEFLTFADFFFDGFIMDYVVQTKIAEARRQIEQAIPLVEGLVNDLKYHYGR